MDKITIGRVFDWLILESDRTALNKNIFFLCLKVMPTNGCKILLYLKQKAELGTLGKSVSVKYTVKFYLRWFFHYSTFSSPNVCGSYPSIRPSAHPFQGRGAYPRIEYIFKQNWRYIQCIQFRFRCFSSIHVFFKGNIWDQNNLSVSFSLDEAKNSPQNNRASGSHYCRGSGFRFSLKFVTI